MAQIGAELPWRIFAVVAECCQVHCSSIAFIESKIGEHTPLTIDQATRHHTLYLFMRFFPLFFIFLLLSFDFIRWTKCFRYFFFFHRLFDFSLRLTVLHFFHFRCSRTYLWAIYWAECAGGRADALARCRWIALARNVGHYVPQNHSTSLIGRESTVWHMCECDRVLCRCMLALIPHSKCERTTIMNHNKLCAIAKLNAWRKSFRFSIVLCFVSFCVRWKCTSFRTDESSSVIHYHSHRWIVPSIRRNTHPIRNGPWPCATRSVPLWCAIDFIFIPLWFRSASPTTWIRCARFFT